MDGRERRTAPSPTSAVPLARSGLWWRQGWLVRSVAVAALAFGAAYLVWRIGWSWRGASPGLFGVLIAAEVFGWFSLAFYTYLAWSVPRTRRPELPPHRRVPPHWTARGGARVSSR